MSRQLKFSAVICLMAIFAAVGIAGAWGIWWDLDLPQYRPAAGGVRPDVGIPPLSIHINHDLHAAPAGVSDVIAGAMNTWSSVPGSTIRFFFAGTPETSCCPKGSACNCDDGKDTISWIGSSWPWQHNTLAVTSLEAYDTATGRVTETDMIINGQDFNWAVSGTPSSTQYDLLSVVTHEMGHMCMLDDLYDKLFSHSTMYGYVSAGSISPRTLDEDDMDGVRYLYPLSTEDIPPPRILEFHTPGNSTTPYDKFISNQNTTYDDTDLIGYGFRDTPRFEVWDSVSSVSSPEISLFQFASYMRLRVNVKFTGPVGSYDVKVINPNGKFDFIPEGLQVNSVGNTPPTVTADADSAATVGKTKSVCAIASDSDGDSLSISWTLVLSPEGSAAVLTNATSTCTSFMPDKPGYYILDVAASDGIVWGYSDATIVTARVSSSNGGGGGSHHHGGGGGGGGGGCSATDETATANGISADIILLMLVPFIVMISAMSGKFIKI